MPKALYFPKITKIVLKTQITDIFFFYFIKWEGFPSFGFSASSKLFLAIVLESCWRYFAIVKKSQQLTHLVCTHQPRVLGF